MTNILTKFFDDNSICTGLCDLKRKTQTSQLDYYYTQQSMPQNLQVRTQRQINIQTQPQHKVQKQSLAQIFAAQQQAYAAQQAYNAQQKSTQFRTNMQQPQQQYQRHNFNNNIQTQKNIQNASSSTANARVIINGSMKKVVSAAIPTSF